ncbi:MAG: GNAT family N-acetyltransferase [Chlorobium sp.]|uniref:GNAT family N-acetyltransferase n=1 Tax=Chlorobium sp. TaxID=1095 RepID=UPI0025C46242|nr:GNAT family N-acetyltransferase [Chlorobium sp.]MCF8382424.1 GNAT family N-acetyltransferase [Chlorobium sp.]
MPHMRLREAVTADIERCSELLGILFSAEREFAPDPAAQRRGLQLVLDSPQTGRVFVCETGGRIAGMVMLLFTVSTFLGKRVALLEDMIVDPAFRAQGIGSRLVGHAVAFARSEGLGRITLLTDHDNTLAREFYHRAGFAASSMVVLRKSLDDQGETP